jgi:hypothetical protein
MKIAQYDSALISYSCPFISKVSDHLEEASEYIRVSSIEEVDFTPIDKSLIIPQKVDALRIAKVKMMQDFDEKISKLQALTQIPEEDTAPLTEFGAGLTGEEEGS